METKDTALICLCLDTIGGFLVGFGLRGMICGC